MGEKDCGFGTKIYNLEIPMNTIRLNTRFDVQFDVKSYNLKQVETMLSDNDFKFNATKRMFHDIVCITVYAVNTRHCENIKKLLKDEKISTY